MPRERMSVLIRGKLYPNVTAAAKALKVSRSTIYSAIARDTTDTVGLGCVGTRNTGGIPAKSVRIGSLEFPSQRAAARALGKSRSYVHIVLARGGKRARANLLARAMRWKAQEDQLARKEKCE